MMKKFLLLVGLVLMARSAVAQVSFGQPERFNAGWLFQLEGTAPAASSPALPAAAGAASLPAEARPDFDDTRWRRLTLPHDWSVEAPMSPQLYSCTGYLPGGIGWYRKHFTTAEALARGEGQTPGRCYLYFEGVYSRSEVYLNGHLLGTRPNGYASFLYDLTPYLLPDGEADNVLTVRVDHSRQADSRWYTGSGIYRDVWMVRAPETHLAQWGSAWRLKSLSNRKAVVEVDIETDGQPQHLSSASAQSHPASAEPRLRARVVVRDAEGRKVAHAATTMGHQEKKTVVLDIRNPHRWSLGDTYLYRVQTQLWEETTGTQSPRLLDQSEMRMGLLTLTFSPDRGFALNGEWMKVKGVCLHHDAGVLGAAVPAEVWQHRLQQLKNIGVNAIRMSHNPQAPVVYDLCDEMGLLVMDEASDEWEFPKRKWLEGWNRGTPGYEGTADFFEEWIDRDVADMVRRDRNHPSVFLWSIGNEVDYPNDPYSHPVLDGDGQDFTQPMYGGYKPDQPHAERIGKIAQRLAGVVRGIDRSRAVTGALAGVVMSNQTVYPEAVDVVGYNYTESRYGEDHKRYPNRVIYGSENRHDYAAWRAVSDNDHIFGQFLWTGADYLGESGPWPARGSSAGLLDLASRRKPNGWYRASLWSTEPVVYIGTYPLHNQQPQRGSHGQLLTPPEGARGRNGGFVSTYAADTWNYREGQLVRVVCYTNQPDVVLTLNGEPVGGTATLDTATNVRYWDIDYRPGTLRAEARGSGASYEVRTSGRPYALQVVQEPVAARALPTGSDEAAAAPATYILTVTVVDEQGQRVALADNDITCRVVGNAHLLGLENGNMSDITGALPIRGGNHRRAHQGVLTAYVQEGLAPQQPSSGFRPRRQDRDAADAAPSQPQGVRVRFSSPLLQDAEITLLPTQ